MNMRSALDLGTAIVGVINTKLGQAGRILINPSH